MQPRQFAKPLLAQLFMGLLDGWCNRKYHVVQFDIGALAGLLQQGVEDRGARGIGGVDDAPMAMAALAGEVELETAVLALLLVVTGEGHALFDQPLDGLAAVLDGEAYGILAAQAATGVEGVGDMGFDGVGVIQHGRHAALGPVGGAVGQVALAQHGDTQVRGQGQGQGQAGSAAADDQDVMLIVLAHLLLVPRGSRNGVT